MLISCRTVFRDRGRRQRLIYGSEYNAKNVSEKSSMLARMRAPFRIRRVFRDWPRLDSPRLRDLKDVHQNAERAFIICNGPSLNRMDLSLLRDEYTFGVNAIYLKFDTLGLRPTYYVVEDNLVAEDRASEINALRGMTKFFPVRLAFCLRRDPEVVYLNHCPESSDTRFSTDASQFTCGGNTVTYTCMQLAFHMGFERVYLIGADHSYVIPDRYSDLDRNENYEIESETDDPNHFDPRYFGKGYRWHNPKVHLMEESYRHARAAYEAHGRKIYNATNGGNLEVFDRVSFESLFRSE